MFKLSLCVIIATNQLFHKINQTICLFVTEQGEIVKGHQSQLWQQHPAEDTYAKCAAVVLHNSFNWTCLGELGRTYSWKFVHSVDCSAASRI